MTLTPPGSEKSLTVEEPTETEATVETTAEVESVEWAAEDVYIENFDRSPCNWIITPVEEDLCEFRNIRTGNRFVNTVAAFNEALRG